MGFSDGSPEGLQFIFPKRFGNQADRSVRPTRDVMEETMFDSGRRPIGRHFCWLLVVVMVTGCGLTASGAAPVPQNGPASTTIADTIYVADGSTAQGNLIIQWPAFVTASGTAVVGGATNVALGAKGALSVALVPNAGASPAGVYYTVVYQLGPSEGKTEYWVVPATTTANLAVVRTTPGSGTAGQPVSMQYVNSALATKADDSTVVHLNGLETISGGKSGAEKKDAAMSFLESALATVDAVAAREIIEPEKFRDGISKIIDGTVECLNASTWTKGNPQAPPVGAQR